MHPEMQYLNTLREILDKSKRHQNRTGVDTWRILGTTHKYDFKHGFPLFTTKKTWWKGIKVELLWFLKGSNNIKYLVDNGVHIWDKDAYRWFKEDNKRRFGKESEMSLEDFVKNIGKDNNGFILGDLGPVYGVQWRNWPSPEGSVDQIANLVDGLKNNPSSRRHIISAWNAAYIEKMTLPPCHTMAQFTIDEGKLWCHMYQRSCDMFLGVPFNVASYSLLTYLIAQVCDLEPGGFIHTMHDCHIYSSHVPMVKELLTRTPKPFPKLVLSPEITDIDQFQLSDLTIEDYESHPPIKAPLHVG